MAPTLRGSVARRSCTGRAHGRRAQRGQQPVPSPGIATNVRNVCPWCNGRREEFVRSFFRTPFDVTSDSLVKSAWPEADEDCRGAHLLHCTRQPPLQTLWFSRVSPRPFPARAPDVSVRACRRCRCRCRCHALLQQSALPPLPVQTSVNTLETVADSRWRSCGEPAVRYGLQYCSSRSRASCLLAGGRAEPATAVYTRESCQIWHVRSSAGLDCIRKLSCRSTARRR